MHDLESSFERLLGRQASEKERQNLYRVKNALGIRDNDALWLVLMTLESYDTLLSKLPNQMHQQVLATVDEVRLAARAAAEAESRQALSTLASAVSETSNLIARRAVDTQRLIALAFYSLSMVLFGALCLVVGFILGSGKMPYWADYPAQSHLPWKVLTAVLQAPAGWLASLVAVGVCCALLYRPLSEKVRPSRMVIAATTLFSLIAMLLIAPLI
jgi:hypothetical protein